MYERIKKLCRDRGISVNKLEQELKIAKGSLCKMTASKPSVARAQKIADYFGVTVDYLMTGEEKFKDTPYFIDDEARKIAQEIANRKDLKILFDTTRDVSAEDLKFVIELVDKIKKGQDVN